MKTRPQNYAAVVAGQSVCAFPVSAARAGAVLREYCGIELRLMSRHLHQMAWHCPEADLMVAGPVHRSAHRSKGRFLPLARRRESRTFHPGPPTAWFWSAIDEFDSRSLP